MKKDLWQRAEELFHAALERPPETRQAFLDEVCGEDGELRAQVERLVSKDQHAGSFLEKPMLADVIGGLDAAGLLVGKQYGPYRILSQLGAGGMGDVYRARDSKLGREVAIKTMTPEFARDPERIARFQREAKLLASLNHPNIAAIHGLEESGGTSFLVLELVEGETLADQIKRGSIPVEQYLKLALQFAEALEAAHQKGVIHRDLKPANIKITPDGKVKVLDFGLAKAFAGDQTDLNLSNSPTLTRSPTLSDAATQQGVILGTAAYMSPEQARGKSVDKRADIWAFGCILFEMLTGSAAFAGKDVTDILAAVIRAEPEWEKLPVNLHWRLREVIERCLKKEARDRYHDISDVRIDIQEAMADSAGLLLQQAIAAPPERKLKLGLLWIAAVAAVSVIIAGVAVWRFKPAEGRQVIRFEYNLPEGQQFGDLTRGMLAVSRDGRQIVYSTPKGLYLRSVYELAAKLIVGTEGDTQQPFFSPDGKWIGYFSVADRKLKKVAINGGSPIPLCDIAQRFWGVWWNEDDTILFGLQSVGMMRISANGGDPECIFKQKAGTFITPQVLPDGKWVLCTSLPIKLAKIVALPLKSGEDKELFRGVDARYLQTEHILYKTYDNSNLYAVQFDLAGLAVKGKPVPVLEGVVQYAISDSGTLAYIPRTREGGASVGRTLVWVNREGKEEPCSAAPNEYGFFRISPDGTRVALSVEGSIYIWDVVRESMLRLTLDEGKDNDFPLWTLDAKRIIYASTREKASYAVYWKAADGTGGAEKLTSLSGQVFSPYSWAKDGRTLVLSELTLAPLQAAGVVALSMEGEHERKTLFKERNIMSNEPRVSGDGRWIAYASRESGRCEVYVRLFPEVDRGKWQVSTNGGHSPLWSPDGRELFYRSGDEVVSVRVETEPTFKPGKPTVLFRGAYVDVSGNDVTLWDISPNGKRFLMMKEAAAEAPRKINIVMNWLEELKQRVPVK